MDQKEPNRLRDQYSGKKIDGIDINAVSIAVSNYTQGTKFPVFKDRDKTNPFVRSVAEWIRNLFHSPVFGVV